MLLELIQSMWARVAQWVR